MPPPSFSFLPILGLPACLIRFAFGDEPASNCLMSSQGTWATRPPCFRRLPVWRAPAGPRRLLRLLIIPCACQLQGQWTVPASLPSAPPTTPPTHRLNQPLLLITMSKRPSTWQHSTSNLILMGKRIVAVCPFSTFINCWMRSSYFAVGNNVSFSDEMIWKSRWKTLGCLKNRRRRRPMKCFIGLERKVDHRHYLGEKPSALVEMMAVIREDLLPWTSNFSARPSQ